MIGGVAAFVALILFITAHEAGHYFAAKATGMKVTEFFLGFGPRIWSFKRGETEYGIKPIFLGAYVKVVGMSALEDVDQEDEGRTYREKPFWKKSVVVLAGVGANFLIAYLMFVGIAVAEGEPVVEDGVPVPANRVAQVYQEVDGVPAPAAEAGLRPGDAVVAVDDVATPDWETLRLALADLPGERVVLTVVRDGETLELPVTLASRMDPATGEEQGLLGFAPDIQRDPVGFLEANRIAGEQTYNAVRFTFVSFGRLLRLDTLGQLLGGIGGAEVDDEVRPVSVIGMVQLGAQADRIGVTNFLFLLAVVNIILGTLNALPLYPLDGGHFAVALYEKITGRQADIRKLVPLAVMVIGLISVIGLLAVVLDIVNPIEL